MLESRIGSINSPSLDYYNMLLVRNAGQLTKDRQRQCYEVAEKAVFQTVRAQKEMIGYRIGRIIDYHG